MPLKCWKSIRKHRYELNPFHTEFIVENIKVYLILLWILKFFRMEDKELFCVVNTMAADDLVV